MLEQGDSVDAVYLDFSKAFDKVDHRILLKKLKSVNITGKIWNWIQEFLLNREQRVRVDSVLSNSRKVVSGVPQGSVLGPLLFLIMIRDIDEHTSNAMVGIFADDTRIWRSIRGEVDQDILQEELQKVYEWADLNNASFNGDKFEVARFELGQLPDLEAIYKAHNNDDIDFKHHIKDLGVWMSANLTFDEHIRVITAKARRIMGLVLRSFKSRKTEVMLPLLKSLIRSQVEYACPIWSPTDTTNINLLEQVQRKFTSKFLKFRTYDEALGFTICNTSYSQRLKELKLYSLQRRRERYTIVYMNKMKLGLAPNAGFESDVGIDNKYIFKPRYDLTNGRSTFFCIGPKLFNSMPPQLRELDDANVTAEKHAVTFKTNLDKHLQTLPDNPGLQTNSLLRIDHNGNEINNI